MKTLLFLVGTWFYRKFFLKKGRLIFIMDDKTKKIADLTRSLLVEIGEDPNREGLLKTPLRSSKAWQFFLKAID